MSINYDLPPMDGTVTISVDDYNTLIEERFELKQQIVKMKDREKELKELFVLSPSYGNEDFNKTIFDAYKEIREEEEDN